jgi:hypothetical protein
MSVGILLPEPVGFTEDSAAFLLELDDAEVSAALGQLCGDDCLAVDGTTAPKPAFTGVVYDTADVDPHLTGFTADDGALRLALSHDFHFDPLRPGGAGTGRIEVTVRSDDVTLGTALLDGDFVAFPADGSWTFSIPLAGVRIARRLEIEIRVESPAGPPAFIDADTRLRIEPTLESVTSPLATIRVDKEVSVEEAQLDFADVDSTVVRHLRSGALRLRIRNPWPITGGLAVLIRTPDGDILETLELRQGTFETRLALDEDEMESILGHLVTLDIRGFASDTGAPFEVGPDERLVIFPRVEAVVRVGEVHP